MTRPADTDLTAMVAQLQQDTALMRKRYETRITELETENHALKARIIELESKQRSNSKTSSKPPSTDSPFQKPAPKSLRRPSGRKPGGQPGHPGATLKQVADPDTVIVHEPEACHSCGNSLTDAPITDTTRTQVFDIPPVKVHVTEHQMNTRQCRCGTATTATTPNTAAAPVQYGPRVLAIMIYLFHGQFLSRQRTADAMAELFDLPASAATVAAATSRAAANLQGFLALVRERISHAAVVNFDETGMRCQQRLAWLHSASTPKYSLLHAHTSRGLAAINDMGVLPGYTGVAVHDAYAPYDHYTTATHSLCGAHLLRELAAVTDHQTQNPTPPAPGVPAHWCWAQQVTDALLNIKNTAETLHATGGVIDPEYLTQQKHIITSGASIGAETVVTNKTEQKHRALARRILKRLDDYLRFTTNPAIPFDNNAAERQIRMAKLRQKISGCMQTLTGAQDFAAIRSYTATATKHGLTTLHALTQLTTNTPWQPETT